MTANGQARPPLGLSRRLRRPGRLIRAFADYARTISGRYDIGDVLYRLTDQVVDVLGVEGAGVSIADQVAGWGS